MKNKKRSKTKRIDITKETPEARKKRVSSGVKFRGVVFENKKRKLLEKQIDDES